MQINISVRSDLQSSRTREVGGVVGRSGEVEKVKSYEKNIFRHIAG